MAEENKTMRLVNDLWEVEISPDERGRVTRLVDRAAGIARVAPRSTVAGQVAEGGHAPLSGLECWPKQGEKVDPRADVIAPFSPVRGRPFEAAALAGGIRLESRAAGLRMAMEWRLPAGAAPLSCRLEMTNEDAPEDAHQFECFFRWSIPADEWPETVAALPGGVALALHPFGEMRCVISEPVGGCAAWWARGTQRGVAVRGVEGIGRFYAVVQNRSFVLGPHSVRRRLAAGESLTAAIEIAPLAWAAANGWPCYTAAAEERLDGEQAGLLTVAERVGPVARWAAPSEGRPLERRVIHLTFQLEPVGPAPAMRLLEEAVAPAGYNQVMVEVDQAFPYRSCAGLTPDWAWSRRQWAEFVQGARGLGLEVIPQFNALGHQPETGLLRACPELAEDPCGWGLCTRHPDTLRRVCGLLDELLEVFEPRAFGIGLDELDLHPVRRVHAGREIFGCCPRCRDADGGELLAEYVLGLHAHLAGRGVETHMWADMLLYEEAHNCRSGLKPGTWRAIDRLPRDIILTDWSYWPVADFGGCRYLLGKGFRVMGAAWYDTRVLAPFARFAAAEGLHGMVQTTWTAPAVEAVPLPCVLLAGRTFANPRGGAGDAAAGPEAEALATGLGVRAPRASGAPQTQRERSGTETEETQP